MSNQLTRSLSGKVHYPAKILLDPNAILHVSLQDVTLVDAPAKELAQYITPDGDTNGWLNFSLTYREADVLPGHRYVIHAQIKLNNKVIMTTHHAHPVVLGVDHLQPQEVLVDFV